MYYIDCGKKNCVKHKFTYFSFIVFYFNYYYYMMMMIGCNNFLWIHRFGKDIQSVDTEIPSGLNAVVTAVVSVAGTLVVICANYPFFMLILLPIALLYIFMQVRFTDVLFFEEEFFICSLIFNQSDKESVYRLSHKNCNTLQPMWMEVVISTF